MRILVLAVYIMVPYLVKTPTERLIRASPKVVLTGGKP